MKRILLIDDDPAIRGMYRSLLVTEGYQVEEADSTETATEYLLRHPVQLILLDINMPDLNGQVMSGIIHEMGRKVKVMVSSVYPVDVQKRFIHNADDYYDKAQSAELLLEKIKFLVGSEHSPHGP